jgi:hypothetical protein
LGHGKGEELERVLPKSGMGAYEFEFTGVELNVGDEWKHRLFEIYGTTSTCDRGSFWRNHADERMYIKGMS